MTLAGRAEAPPPGSAPDRHAADVAFGREVAVRAGELLMERYERVERVDYKSAKDIVTEVDHLSEALVIEAIKSRFPGDAILAEESGEHRAHAVAVPPSASGGDGPTGPPVGDGLPAGRTWVVDPVDGTINYANGIPFFCIAIALVEDGRPVAGIVHDPTRDETFWATSVGPALRNGKPLAVSRKERLTDYVVHVALGGPRVATRLRALRREVRITRSMGSSALGLAYVAAGRFDAFVQSGGMSAWDVAAAALIAERAGAIVTDPRGGPWWDASRGLKAFGAVAAPPAQHARLLELTRE